MKSSQRNLNNIDKLIHKASEDTILINPSPEQYAAIYVRTSSSNDSYSIQSQIDDCKKYIRKNNLILYDVYKDKESARKKKFYERKDFKRLLNDMEAGMFKNLILIRRDRLSRRIDDFMHLKRIFRKHNIRDYYIKEGNLNFENDTYITSFLENILMSISTLEPEYISQRTKGGRQNLRDQGIFQSSNPPTGYNKVKGKKHEFEKNNEQAKLIEDIFNYYREEIIDKNKTLADLYKHFKGINIAKVNKSFLDRIIQRPLYGGKMIKNEDDNISDCVKWDNQSSKYVLIYDNENKVEKIIECTNFPIIVDWNIWTQVFLHYYTLNNPPVEANYLFKDLIKCSNCNTILTLKNGFLSCKCLNLSVEVLIENVFNEIIDNTDPKSVKLIFGDKIKKVNQNLNLHHNNLNSLRNSLRSKLDKYISTKNSNIKKDIEKLQNEINDIQNLITKLGEEKLKFLDFSSNINLFRTVFRMLNKDNIEFIKNNWEPYNELINKFIVKVVLTTKNGKLKKFKVKYK